MRGLITFILTGFIAAAALAPCANAAAQTAASESVSAYSLATIMNDPQAFADREVMFLCRFAANAKLFRSVRRFDAASHANFAVWPDKAALWDARERKNALPTLYLSKSNAAVAEVFGTLERYDLVVVTGRVVEVHSGLPCILVSAIERVDSRGTKLTQPMVTAMRRGREALRIGEGEAAARHFEQAVMLGLPGEYRARAYERLAQANLLCDRLDLARASLRQAAAISRDDPVLHAALADVALRMNIPQEALAHASYALDIQANFPKALGIKAEALAALGDVDEAAAVIGSAASMSGFPPYEKAMLDVRRARVNIRAGRVADAASAYAAAVEVQTPLAGEAWLHREIGLFYEKLALESGNARHLDSAFNAYEQAFRLEPAAAETLYTMMEVEFRRQKLADAPDFTVLTALAAKAAEVMPGYVPARILEGRVLFAMGRTGEAEHNYQTVATRVGNDPMALIALAEAFVELGRDDEAAAAVRRARAMQPWNDRVQAVGSCLERGVAMTGTGSSGDVVEADVRSAAISGGEFPSIDEFFKTVPRVYNGGEPEKRRPSPVEIAAGGARNAAVLEAWNHSLRAANEYPQEIQASVKPSLPGDSGGARVPTTRVEIPADSFRDRKVGGDEALVEPLSVKNEFTYSGIISDGGAYASMSPVQGEYVPAADEARIPHAFSFEPDASPVLLADVRSPGKEGRDMPVRNVNVYRRWAGGTRPAEIIEREPVSPRVGLDTPAMVPPKDGMAHRAEVRIPQVRLPSSSPGIGATGESRDRP